MNRGTSHVISSGAPGVESYAAHTNTISFEPSMPTGRRNSKLGMVNAGTGGQSPHARSVVKDFVRSRKGSSEDEHEGPLEIRVQVQEDVKLDYDSVYTDPSNPSRTGVSYHYDLRLPTFANPRRLL